MAVLALQEAPVLVSSLAFFVGGAAVSGVSVTLDIYTDQIKNHHKIERNATTSRRAKQLSTLSTSSLPTSGTDN